MTVNQGTEGKAILEAEIKIERRTRKKKGEIISPKPNRFIEQNRRAVIKTRRLRRLHGPSHRQRIQRNSFSKNGQIEHIPEVEILNVNVLVRRRLALAPQEETLLGRHFLDGNILDGEAQDDGPNHTQSHFGVAINDFCGEKQTKRVLKVFHLNVLSRLKKQA
jgi:hypothetical protein